MQVWRLASFTTVPEAYEAYLEVQKVPLKHRRFHGSKQEARNSSKAFSRFGLGLAAEVHHRVAAGTSKDQVVLELEAERLRIPPSKNFSSLQQLCSQYNAGNKKRKLAAAEETDQPVS